MNNNNNIIIIIIIMDLREIEEGCMGWFVLAQDKRVEDFCEQGNDSSVSIESN
jgi:hypothetical protein